MSYAAIDQCFLNNNYQEAYETLKKRYESGERDVELLWRLNKSCNEVSFQRKKDHRKEIIFESKKYADEAYAANPHNSDVVKHTAVTSGMLTDYLGVKEKVAEGSKCKEYLDTAIAMRPNDEEVLHVRGRWRISVANLNWLEQKAAAVLHKNPPTATVEEAIADFEAVYKIRPKWIENLVQLAKALLQKKDKVGAKKYLEEALTIKSINETEEDYLKEAKKLLKDL